MKAEQLLDKACMRCEEWPSSSDCKYKDTCPVYALYTVAKERHKTRVINPDEWAIPPTPIPEMI